MRPRDHFKESKNFITYSVAAAVIGTLLALSMGGCGRGEEGEIISSKRVQIALEETENEEYGAEEDETPEAVEEEARAIEEKASAPQALPVPAPALTPSAERKETVRPAPPPPQAPVKTAKKEPAKTATKAVSAEKVWAVNVASFSKVVDALKLKDDLDASGYNAYVTRFDDGKKTWHRVRVGFYSSRDEAERAGDSISKKYTSVGEPWVVKPDSSEIRANRK